ncbi:MAG: dihydrolipoyllysine-residue acetyltransferase [Candidatus Baltobacteraceae bacterium]
MATTNVAVPDIGDFQDVPVIEVLVKPGDTVKKNDSLVVLESEKASMEVPADADGVVQAVNVNVGDKVSKGTVLLTLSAGGAPQPESTPQAAEPAAAQAAVELRVPDIGDFSDIPVIEVLVKAGDAIAKDDPVAVLESDKASMEVPAAAGGTVQDVRVKVGDKASKGTVLATVLTTATAPAPAAKQPAPPAQTIVPAQSVRERAQAPSENGSAHASPSIRRFARELGVDLARVAPSGPNRRVRREDVQRLVKDMLRDGGAHVAASESFSVAAWPRVDFAQFGEIERKPLTRIQKLSGPNLHRNWVMIPHVTQNDDADVTDLEPFRKMLNVELERSGVKVTMLAFLMKAAVAALKQFPAFNSSLDGDDLVFKRYYNIGFAADTPNGLVVPVIRNADGKGIADLAKETSELAALAREGKLSLAQMQGGTFTISSLGSIGGTYFTPIINAPEVAILGACKAGVRPVWNGKEFTPRLMQPLSLSYDHRVIDGASAARFTGYLASVLADLRRALV